jgi:hypothetical protein
MNRTPRTRSRIVTIYFPDNVLAKIPSPEEKAKTWAIEILRGVAKDPAFSVFHCDVRSTEIDLSQYAMPNLESSEGSKAWIN